MGRLAWLPFIAGFVNAALAAQPLERSYPASADAQIEVSNARGRIEVNGWEKNEIAVSGQLAEGARLETEGKGGWHRLQVVADAPKSWVVTPAAGAALVLRVPRASSLKIRTISGTVGVVGLESSGALQIDTVNGAQKVDGQVKQVLLRSVSGPITFRGHSERGEVVTVSGEVAVESGEGGRWAVQTVSGSVAWRGSVLERVSIQTASGRVEAAVQLSAGARVDVRTVRADVLFRLPPDVSARMQVASRMGTVASDWGTVRANAAGSQLLHIPEPARGTLDIESLMGGVSLKKEP